MIGNKSLRRLVLFVTVVVFLLTAILPVSAFAAGEYSTINDTKGDSSVCRASFSSTNEDDTQREFEAQSRNLRLYTFFQQNVGITYSTSASSLSLIIENDGAIQNISLGKLSDYQNSSGIQQYRIEYLFPVQEWVPGQYKFYFVYEFTEGGSSPKKTIETNTLTLNVICVNHTYGEWIERKAATCTEDGEEYRICSLCDNEENRIIASLDHDYGPWVVRIPATYSSVGEEYRTCSRCGNEESREIAILEPSSAYTVTFDSNGGSAVRAQVVVCGETAVEPKDPVKDNYTFGGWQLDGVDYDFETPVTANITLKAVWAINEYTLKFVDWDGTEISNTTYDYGTEAASIMTPGDPTREADAQYSYTFAGWTPEIEDVTADAVYTATYTKTVNEYTVKFVDWDGTEISSTTYEYGTTADTVLKPADPVRAGNAQYSYEFTGWTPKIEDVAADALYTATYAETVNEYAVKFVDWDGTEISNLTYDYGTEAASVLTPSDPTRAADAQYSYTFAGWTPEIADVTSDAVYTATYAESVNEYTVKFVDWDGEEISSAMYEYGTAADSITVPSDPVRADANGMSYTFVLWMPTVTDVTSDATYKAVYNAVPAKYTVTFDSDGGSAVAEQTVDHNTAAVEPKPPVKDNYTFGGWQLNGTDYDFETPVTANITLKAVWVQNVAVIGGTPYPSLQAAIDAAEETATVKLLIDTSEAPQISKTVNIDLNGKTLMIAPDAMKVTGGEVYVSNGKIESDVLDAIEVIGEGTMMTVGEDLTIDTSQSAFYVQDKAELAIAGAEIHTDGIYVPVYGDGGSVISMISGLVHSENTSAIGVEPGSISIMGGTVIGGNLAAVYGIGGTSNVSLGDGTITGPSEGIQLTDGCTGIITGGAISSDNLAIGVGYSDGQAPATLTVVGAPIVNGNIQVKAGSTATIAGGTFSYDSMIVTDGSTLAIEGGFFAEDEIASGFLAEGKTLKPSDKVPGYYEVADLFTVSFVDDDGAEISTKQYADGTMADAIEVPEDPIKEADAQYSYTFAGWTPEIAAVTADAVYTATYTEAVNEYTVKFVDWDGTEISSTAYGYGTTADTVLKPADPVKEGDAQHSYTFAGWAPEIADVTANAVYTATYTEKTNEYTVKFVDWDGTEISSSVYGYGTTADTVLRPADPVRSGNAQYSYTFAGWTPEIADVTSDAVYTATYAESVNEYTVKFVDWDGEEISSAMYEYGTAADSITVPSDPVRADANGMSYTFVLWMPTVTDVTSDATYKAVYNAVPAKYTVTFDSDGGSAVAEQTVDHNTAAVEPKPPVKDNCTFGGWQLDGVDYDFETPVTSNITLKAVWDKDLISIKNAVISGVVHKPYTGEAVIQDLEITLGINGENIILEENRDFTVTYENNIDVGIVKVTVTGMGNYTDSQEREFRVLFKDVPWEHSFSNSVYWAADNEIAKGYTGSNTGLFGVNDTITRGQVVMFLWRAAGRPEPAGSSTIFPDVPTSHSFYKAVQWAYENKITTGYKSGPNAGMFGVNDNCTRGQIVTFMLRYKRLSDPSAGPAGTEQTFNDVPTAHSFYKAIQWAYENKITTGYKDGSGNFGVNDSCTRGQCVTFLYRVMN